MIQIPQEVRTLLKRDSVYKHFRAVFEDGTPDICNRHILKESLKLRESVFSGDSFTFGAAEAPTIQFETVGVGNILGKWFQAWLEIDASTLPRSMQVDMPDLEMPVYPIALGRFCVTACPRNHGAMVQRRVAASANPGTGGIHLGESLENIINTRWVLPKSARTKIPIDFSTLLLIAGYEQANPDYIETILDETGIQMPGNAQFQVNLSVTDTADHPNAAAGAIVIPSSGRYVAVDVGAIVGSVPGPAAAFAGFGDFIPKPDLSGYAHDLAAQIWSMHPGDIGFVSKGAFGSVEPVTLDFLEDWLSNTWLPLCPELRPHYIYTVNGSNEQHLFHQPFGEWFSPVTALKYAYGVRYVVPLSIAAPTPPDPEYYPLVDGGETVTYRLCTYNVPDSAKNAVDKITYALDGQKMPKAEGGGILFQREDVEKAIRAALELRGAFGQYSRGGGAKLLRLSNENPLRISRGMYEECWWDEYDLEPIGSISYRLADEDNAYTFGDGRSTYALACSDIFGLMKSPTEEEIEAILAAELVPALKRLKYTPIDLTARGLPYLEAGEAIIVEAEDGTEVESLVLTRELSGIQHLTDAIDADGITIVEVDT